MAPPVFCAIFVSPVQFLMRYHQCWSQLVQKTSRLTTSQSSPAPSQGFPHHTVAASPAGLSAAYAASTAVAAAGAEEKPASDKGEALTFI